MFWRVLFIFIVAASLGISSADAAEADANRVADFATLPFMQGPKISPNGRYVAAEVAVKGVQYFAVFDLTGIDKLMIVGNGEIDLNW